MAAPFVGVALKVCEELEIVDKKGQGMAMRFSKLYPPEKMGRIVERAKKFYWWQKNPTAAFMKAIGEENKEEKDGGVGKATPKTD